MRKFKVSSWSYKQSYLECIALLSLGVEDRNEFTGDYSLQLLIVVYVYAFMKPHIDCAYERTIYSCDSSYLLGYKLSDALNNVANSMQLWSPSFLYSFSTGSTSARAVN